MPIDPTGHSTSFTPATDETCTESGNTAYWYCSNCKKYFSDGECTDQITIESTVIKATGHDAVFVPAKEATNTEDGNIAYWYCAKCGKYFSDKECTQEITLESTVIKALNICTVTFDAANDEAESEEVTVNMGESYTLPECGFTAPSGKEFDKWDINGTAYEAGQSVTVDSDITVTALWKDKEIVPVRGDANGDGVDNMQDYALFQRYPANWKVLIILSNCDLDGNGLVNMQDYALFQRRLAGWYI